MTKDRLTLVFFVDALGARIARELGCFRDIAPHAYTQRTILGYSCAAQPTILTGLKPSEHEHWGMYHRTDRSDLSPLRNLRFIPKAVGDHRRFRRRLLSAHRARSGWTGYYNFYRVPYRLFGEFDLSEKRDIYAPGGFDHGVESIFDVLAASSIPYRVWNWRTGLDQALSELADALTAGPPMRFALLYTAVIDAFLHEHVGDAAAVGPALESLEAEIARAVELARDAYRDVDVVIFSDHGMAETTGQIDLMALVGSLGLEHERDYLSFYDSTMGRFWFGSERARGVVTEALLAQKDGSVLTDDDLKREGIFFEDRRYGELVFLADPGVLIVPSYMGTSAPRGMHGFTPDHEDSDAVLMSDRPIEPAPTNIADDFRVMLTSVTANSPDGNGHDE